MKILPRSVRMGRTFWSWLRYGRSKRFPFGCIVMDPIVFSRECITLGQRIWIGHAARMEAVCRYNDKVFTPKIILGDNVTIEQNLHMTCANRIVIGKNTAIAANVTITDIDHPYFDPDKPVERHDIKVLEVEIGEDCKIYNNVVVLPGVHIGKHCVIGANSVVVRDVPGFCIAAGTPARVFRRYDSVKNVWVRVEEGVKC